MKKVKFFSTFDYIVDHDEFKAMIHKDITDWVELPDEVYRDLESYKHLVEGSLRTKGVIGRNESLIVVAELSETQSQAVKVEIGSIIDDVIKGEKLRQEKEKKRQEKLAERAKQKNKERELKQLKKLKEKWGDIDE